MRYAGSRLSARVRFMRVIREYFHNHALDRGRLLLHAAGVVQKGRAIAIAGRKNAGKTTAMLRLLERDDTAFLSNDRVLVDVEPGPSCPWRAYGRGLRDGTLRLIPHIASAVRLAGDFREDANERSARGPAPAVVTAGVVRLSPRQLCDAVNRPMVHAAPLAAVLFVDRRLAAGSRPSPARARRSRSRAGRMPHRRPGGRLRVRRLRDLARRALSPDALAAVAQTWPRRYHATPSALLGLAPRLPGYILEPPVAAGA